MESVDNSSSVKNTENLKSPGSKKTSISTEGNFFNSFSKESQSIYPNLASHEIKKIDPFTEAEAKKFLSQFEEYDKKTDTSSKYTSSKLSSIEKEGIIVSWEHVNCDAFKGYMLKPLDNGTHEFVHTGLSSEEVKEHVEKYQKDGYKITNEREMTEEEHKHFTGLVTAHIQQHMLDQGVNHHEDKDVVTAPGKEARQVRQNPLRQDNTHVEESSKKSEIAAMKTITLSVKVLLKKIALDNLRNSLIKEARERAEEQREKAKERKIEQSDLDREILKAEIKNEDVKKQHGL